MQAIPLLFRCDASSELGWGHFRRCYALAEIAQQSGRYKVYFLCRSLPRGLDKKLKEIHASVQYLDEAATIEQDLQTLHSMFDLMSRKNIIVVIDHPGYTTECFQSLKKDQRVSLLAFDDGYARHYSTDFVILPHLDAEKFELSTDEQTQKLLGPKYVMIRDEIHTLKQNPTERIAESFQFLITLGGGDKWGHSIKAIEAVRQSNLKFETHLVVGTQWPHTERAKRLIGNHPRIHFYEDPSFFPQLLARADLALTAAGGTTYELAFLGIPMLTVAMASNQINIAKAWESRGVSEHIGPVEALTPELILDRLMYWIEREQELEERGVKAQKLVDGRGKFRVLERVAKFIQQKKEIAA